MEQAVVRARVGWGPVGLLAGVVAAADLLMFDVEAGVALALFGALLVLAVRAACGPARVAGRDGAWLAVLLLGVLPSVERVGPVSVLFWGLGVVGASVAIALGDRMRWEGLPRAALRFAARAPAEDIAGIARALGWAAGAGRGSWPAAGAVRGWLLPVAAAAVLGGLLLAANPVLSMWAARLGELPFDLGPLLDHVPFWVFTAALAWPYLALSHENGWLSAAGVSLSPMGRPVWVNEAAVRATLVAVNAVMAVQTVMDAGFLWGGIALPEGVTYAEYAHRGAYPLVLTALLAGGLALVARPFAGARGIGVLLGLWLGQNLLLVGSSLLRLDLYVDAYGLTQLRLAAAVWMGLVAGGLGLTGWQVWAGRSNGWLLARVAVMAGAVLWGCSFVNGPALVASYNFARLERTGKLDVVHVCQLGWEASVEIRRFEIADRRPLCDRWEESGWSVRGLEPAPPPDESWRDWGFREWRIRRSLAALEEGA